MDMSFANQALCAEYVAQHHSELQPQVYVVPEAIDAEVARLKLAALGHRARADDRRAGRLRQLVAARHLSVDDRPDARRGAPTSYRRPGRSHADAGRTTRRGCPTAAGPRRSASRTSSARSSAWPSRGSTATMSTGSRAARPRPAGRVLVHRAEDGTTADLTPAPFDVRTQVHEYGGGSYTVAGGTTVFSNRGRRAPVPARPRSTRRPCRSPRRAPTATPTCASMPAGGGSWPSARTTRATDSPWRRSSRCRSTASASRSSSSRGPTSSPPRGSRRTARRSPGSSGTTRTCPGTRPGCDSPR